jgi:hypothetical protein
MEFWKTTLAWLILAEKAAAAVACVQEAPVLTGSKVGVLEGVLVAVGVKVWVKVEVAVGV